MPHVEFVTVSETQKDKSKKKYNERWKLVQQTVHGTKNLILESELPQERGKAIEGYI